MSETSDLEAALRVSRRVLGGGSYNLMLETILANQMVLLAFVIYMRTGLWPEGTQPK